MRRLVRRGGDPRGAVSRTGGGQEPSGLSRARLRRLTVWAPAAFFGLLAGFVILLRPYPLPPPALWTFLLLILGLACGGAYGFSRFVFANIQRQEHELVRRNRELAVLNAVGEELSHSLNASEVLPHALDAILEGIGVEAAEIFVWEEQTREMVLRAHRGLFPEVFQEVVRFEPGRGFPGQVAASGEAIVVHDLARDARFLRTGVVAKGFQAFASVPLRARDRVLGVLNVAAFDPRRPTKEDMRLLVAVGHQLGMAIENLRLSEQLQVMAVVGERQRLAREIHDSLAQDLGFLHLRLADAQRRLWRETARVEEELGELKQAARQAYEEVRQAIFGLRATVSRGSGLIPTLAEYLRDWSRQTGIAARVETDDQGAPQFSPAVEVQLIRIVQEALANIRKHAGAERVVVELSSRGELATVTIRDDGRGFDPALIASNRLQAFGLETMRERAETVGGRFDLSSRPGRGTTVEVRLPVVGRPNGERP